MKKMLTMTIVLLLSIAVMAFNDAIAIEENHPPELLKNLVESEEVAGIVIEDSLHGNVACTTNFCPRTDMKAVSSDYSDLIQMYSEYDWPNEEVVLNNIYNDSSEIENNLALLADTIKIRGKTNTYRCLNNNYTLHLDCCSF